MLGAQEGSAAAARRNGSGRGARRLNREGGVCRHLGNTSAWRSCCWAWHSPRPRRGPSDSHHRRGAVTYYLTAAPLSYTANAALLQAQPWWGDEALSFAISEQLLYQLGDLEGGPGTTPGIPSAFWPTAPTPVSSPSPRWRPDDQLPGRLPERGLDLCLRLGPVHGQQRAHPVGVGAGDPGGADGPGGALRPAPRKAPRVAASRGRNPAGGTKKTPRRGEGSSLGGRVLPGGSRGALCLRLRVLAPGAAARPTTCKLLATAKPMYYG